MDLSNMSLYKVIIGDAKVVFRFIGDVDGVSMQEVLTVSTYDLKEFLLKNASEKKRQIDHNTKMSMFAVRRLTMGGYDASMKIVAIKMVRENLKTGLKEAKSLVERWMEDSPIIDSDNVSMYSDLTRKWSSYRVHDLIVRKTGSDALAGIAIIEKRVKYKDKSRANEIINQCFVMR